MLEKEKNGFTCEEALLTNSLEFNVKESLCIENNGRKYHKACEVM